MELWIGFSGMIAAAVALTDGQQIDEGVPTSVDTPHIRRYVFLVLSAGRLMQCQEHRYTNTNDT